MFSLVRTQASLLLAAWSLLFFERAHAEVADPILWSVAWSHDGSQFAVGGVDALWVFDSGNYQRKSLLPSTQGVRSADADAAYLAVTSVSWHPNGNLLAVSSQGEDVNGIYDTISGNRIALRVDQGRGVSWSPDGELLSTSSPNDGHLRIWKRDGALVHDRPRYLDAVGLTGVAWQPSGDRIVTIGKRITLHDAQGNGIQQFAHRPEAEARLNLLLCVQWHPSGQFFAVGDYGNEMDDPVLQFRSADGELLKSITIEGGAEIRNIAWNHDGSLLATASDKLRIWTAEGELKHEGQSPDLLWGVAWRPDGESVLTSSLEGRVTLWSPTAKAIRTIVAPPDSQSATSRPRTTHSDSRDASPK